MRIRDRASNPDLQVQSLASCRLDDPGACGRSPPRGARRSVDEGHEPHSLGTRLRVHHDAVPAGFSGALSFLGEREPLHATPSSSTGSSTQWRPFVSSVSFDVHLRTMLSKPLANPSTLDHATAVAQPTGARPTWRSFGARASHARPEIRRLKQTLIAERSFQSERRGSFSLRRGLDSS
jgi:hypothetical protein